MVRTARSKLAARRDYAALIDADNWVLKDVGITREEALRRHATARFWWL